ncbi:TaqI-like C-terminal specificity domain-containing protein [Orenia metallireducens]|uniref:site-specific DNA-methyltransferase (adenine-specific) n=1 Tax=Orenia metallireducens TaxID=1413210 RepID=A0A285I3C6_9FIRM|nr:N-6 DNA methylase [Orenia metallireducens]SNY41451.1 TaqI-like C-terminal specificity domain-containing protein [Orenia metallireducens]
MADLFNKKILDKHLDSYEIDDYERKLKVVTDWQRNLKTLKGVNEIGLQSAFLTGFFRDILDYKSHDKADIDGCYSFKNEPATEVDATRPDGTLGLFNTTDKDNTIAVIELKSPKHSLDEKQKSRTGKDYGTPVEQAFGYATKHDGCQWVIVSNMIEIRLYKYTRGQGHYDSFLIDSLDQEENFKKFNFLLSKANLINPTGTSLTFKLSEETYQHEENISTEFYNLYKQVRINLFEHLKENNSDYEEELLLEKAQKFLDRITFICFCEDLALLPADIIHKVIENTQKNEFTMSQTPIWDGIRALFKYVDQGNPSLNINAYNGGLFKADEVLDKLLIKDEFFTVIDEISSYDFDSDLNVNILGHIFEQSISDIEEIKSDLQEDEYDKTESKRKKDGIFYTPEYITKYIVENSIGKYLEDIKQELGYYELPEIEEGKNASAKGRYKKKHLEFYEQYEERLKNIKVLDPACGSGAFLNQAFDYLFQEHQWIHRQIEFIKDVHGQRSIFGLAALHKDILQNNIYGVDLNAESVEITKLSLWLKTASPNNPLANLDNNIKCGNSLIDDSEIVGDKAFKWEEEFAEIMDSGGFDVVIGNPPYVRTQYLSEIDKSYYSSNYMSAKYGGYDIYTIFVEKGHQLLNNSGYLGYILPNKFFTADYAKGLREYLLRNNSVKQIISFGDNQIFDGISTYTCLLFLNNSNPSFEYYEIKSNVIVQNELSNLDKNSSNIKFGDINYSRLNIDEWILNSNTYLNLLDKLNEFDKLEKVAEELFQGVITSADTIYLFEKFEFIDSQNIKVFSKELNQEVLLEKDILRKVVRSGDVKRYNIKYTHLLLYPYKFNKNNDLLYSEQELKDKFPLAYDYLKKVQTKLENRERGSFKDENWFRFGRTQNISKWEQSKLMVPYMLNRLSCSIDISNNYYFVNVTTGGYGITLKNENNYKIISLLLNSQLLDFYFKIISSRFRGGYFGANKNSLISLPIVIPNNQSIYNDKADIMIKSNQKLTQLKKSDFIDLITKYTSQTGQSLTEIVELDGFYNKIYSGRASKLRDITVTINDTILTLYVDKSSNGQYELMKFEVKDKYQREYIKTYLENLTEEQLEQFNDNLSGNIVKKVLQIEIPDYDKYQVVRKVVNEWNSLQDEIQTLEEKIATTDKEIDRMVYQLYELTEEEIAIVEESLDD